MTSFPQKVGIRRFQNKYSSREPSFLLPLADRGQGIRPVVGQECFGSSPIRFPAGFPQVGTQNKGTLPA